MKASVLVFGCLVLAAPAQAFNHGAPHGGHHGHGFGHHHLSLGIFAQGASPDPIAPAPEAPTPQLALEPAPRCPLPAPVAAPARSSGPRIIYIGHQPEISGPKVIYGTE